MWAYFSFATSDWSSYTLAAAVASVSDTLESRRGLLVSLRGVLLLGVTAGLCIGLISKGPLPGLRSDTAIDSRRDEPDEARGRGGMSEVEPGASEESTPSSLPPSRDANSRRRNCASCTLTRCLKLA